MPLGLCFAITWCWYYNGRKLLRRDAQWKCDKWTWLFNDIATSTGHYDVNVTPNRSRLCYPWHQGHLLGTVYQSWSYPSQGTYSCISFMYFKIYLWLDLQKPSQLAQELKSKCVSLYTEILWPLNSRERNI